VAISGIPQRDAQAKLFDLVQAQRFQVVPQPRGVLPARIGLGEAIGGHGAAWGWPSRAPSRVAPWQEPTSQ
jgi:hypothetical protein